MMLGLFCGMATGTNPPQPCSPPGHYAVQPDSTVTHDGEMVGWYVDNEEPKQAEVVNQHLAEGWPVVIAGIPPNCIGPCPHFNGAINAREVYPFTGPHQSVPPNLPRAEAYITQWRFAWPGHPAPTRKQRNRLLLRLMAKRPKMILLY